MGTRTSGFGAGKREGHDASDFYARFTPPEISDDDTVAAAPEVDRIWHGDARRMHQLVDNSVALVVTSPPYFAGKEYEQALGEGHVPKDYLDYLAMLEDVFAECVRVLEPGGRIAVNVANLGRKPYRSLSSDVITILQDRLRMLLRGEVIWWKAKGATGSCAWGSFQKPSNPVLRDLTERVIIASKGRLDRAVSPRARETRELPSQATLWADDFMEMTTDIWEIPSESATRVGHPAPFPVELPHRLIELFTYRDELVLDPFMGSGSTALAALRSGRHYVGYDTDLGYIETAEARIESWLATAPPERAQVILPATPEAADPGEDPMRRAVREGRKARDIAAVLLEACGFDQIRPDVKLPGGIEVNFEARGRDGMLWWFDVSGAFTTSRPGLRRTDTLWKAIGKAAVVERTEGEQGRYVLLTTDAPTPKSSGARALDKVVGLDQPIHDVIELLDEDDQQRLREYAAGARMGPG